MFVIEDTSGYGVLKALVEVLQKDAANANAATARYSPRSHDFMRAVAVRGHANSTIAFIMTTNVWREGEQKEREQQTFHYHVSTAEGNVYSASDEDTLRAWLKDQGATSTDAFGLLAEGYAINHCRRYECIQQGQWLTLQVAPQT